MMLHLNLRTNLRFLCVLILGGGIAIFITPPSNAQKLSAFELLVASLRNPFLSTEKKPLPKKEEVNEQKIVEQKVDPVVEVPKPEPIIPPPVSVSGIVFHTIRPQAIVNDVVVQKGDVLGDITILEIKEGGVLFLYKSNEFFVKYSNK